MEPLNLSALKFAVDTAALKDAVNTVKELRTELGKPMPANKVKTVDTTEQAKTNAKASKVTIDMLEREKDILKFMTQEYTRGQASKLAYAKATGYTTDKIKEMGEVLKIQRTLIGGDPFDKSTAGLERLRNEYRETTEAIKQFDMQSGLSGKQSRELARDKLRMEEAGKSNQSSPAAVSSSIANYEKDFIKQANLNNALTNSEKELARVHRETANATRWVADEMERSSSTLAAMSGGLNNGGKASEKYAQNIARFSQRVRQSGIDSETAAKKIQTYTAEQHALQKLEQEHQGKYLSRALAPQISDIAVSLQGGMNPLTVMMQQGMQVRDLIGSVQLDAQQLQTAMRGAATGFVQSIAGTAKAIGTLVGGAFLDAGKGVTNFASKISGLTLLQEQLNARIAAQTAAIGSASTGITLLSRGLSGLSGVISTLIGASLGFLAVALGAVAIGFYKAFKEGEALSKQMAINGGAFGLTKDSAYSLAASMNSVGVTTTDAVAAISEITKHSSLASQNISTITQSAVEMQKYAGVAINDTIKAFADLAKDPVEGIIKLAMETGKVSPAVVQLVMDLMEQGKKTEAVTVATDAMRASNKKTTDQIIENAGYLVRAFMSVKGAAGSMWDAINGIGRPKKIADVGTELAVAEKALQEKKSIATPAYVLKTYEAQRDRLSAEYTALAAKQTQAKKEKDQAESAARMKRISDIEEKFGSKQIKATSILDAYEADIAEQKRKGLAVDEKQYELTKKKIQESGKEKSKGGGSSKAENKALAEYKRASEAYLDLMNKGSGYSAEYNNELAGYNLLKEKGKLHDGTLFTQQMYNKAVDELNKKQPYFIAQEKKKKEIDDQAIKDQEVLNDLLGNAAGLQNNFNDKADALGRILSSGKASVEEVLSAYAELQRQTPEDKRLAKLDKIKNKHKEEISDAERGYKLVQKSLDLDLNSSFLNKETATFVYGQYERQLKLADDQKAIEQEIATLKSSGVDTEATNDELQILELKKQQLVVLSQIEEKTQAIKFIQDGLSATVTLNFEGNKVAEGINSVVSAFTSLQQKEAQYDKMRENAWSASGGDAKKYAEILTNIDKKQMKDQIGSYGDMANAAKGFFKEGTSGYNALENVAQAFHMAQVAMNVIEMAQMGIKAVLNQAQGDPYTAWARMAAMAAAVGALGVAIGGGGGKGYSSSEGTNQGTGTVLGDKNAKSESLSKSLEFLNRTELANLRYTTVMTQSLKNIENARKGVTSGIVLGLDSLVGSIKQGLQSSFASKAVEALTFGNSKLMNVALKSFGKKVTVVGQGLQFAAQKLSEINTSGTKGEMYADIKTDQKVFSLTLWSTVSTETKKMSEELTKYFNTMFKEITRSIKTAGKVLGLNTDEINKKLEDHVVDLGKIDLTGLTGEQISEKINNVMSAEADKIAKEVIPGLESMQQVGEGYYQTVVRAAAQLEMFNRDMEKLGNTLRVAGIDGALFADAVIQTFGSFDEYAAAMDEYYNTMYSASEQQSFAMSQISNSLGELGLSLPDSIAAWRDLTNSMDLTTEAGREAYAALIKLGPEFANIVNQVASDAGITANSIADVITNGMLNRISADEAGAQLADIVVGGIYNAIANSFANQISSIIMKQIVEPVITNIIKGGAMSAVVSAATMELVVDQALKYIDAFKALMENPDFRAGMERLYESLVSIGLATGGVAEVLPVYTQSMDNGLKEMKRIADERYGLETRLLTLQGKTSELRARELAKLDESNRALQEQIWALEDAQNIWKSVADSIISEIERIRDELLGASPEAQSASMALFNTLTAQARAGDSEAAAKLPELSQNILELAGGNSSTLAELQRTRAAMMVSLEQTNAIINGFMGTGTITGNGTVVSNSTSGSVVATPQNVVVNVNSSDVVSRLESLIAVMQTGNINTQTTAVNTGKINKLFERVAQDGDSIRTTAV